MQAIVSLESFHCANAVPREVSATFVPVLSQPDALVFVRGHQCERFCLFFAKVPHLVLLFLLPLGKGLLFAELQGVIDGEEVLHAYFLSQLQTS